jgi:hypothetical protein
MLGMLDFDTTFYIIVAGRFLTALSNAAFSAGGAMIVLAVTSVVLPVAAIVPIHSTLLIGSTSTRALIFWKHHAIILHTGLERRQNVGHNHNRTTNVRRAF